MTNHDLCWIALHELGIGYKRTFISVSKQRCMPRKWGERAREKFGFALHGVVGIISAHILLEWQWGNCCCVPSMHGIWHYAFGGEGEMWHFPLLGWGRILALHESSTHSSYFFLASVHVHNLQLYGVCMMWKLWGRGRNESCHQCCDGVGKEWNLSGRIKFIPVCILGVGRGI